MSKLRDIQRLEVILEKLVYIENIVHKCASIHIALRDKEITRPAILMHLTSMAEQFIKLSEPELIELLSRSIKGAMSIRNFIAHDYEGVNLEIIESTIRETLPNLKQEINRILKDASHSVSS